MNLSGYKGNIIALLGVSSLMTLCAHAYANDDQKPILKASDLPPPITQVMTLEEIRKDPTFFKDKIILHYDQSIKGVEGDILALRRRELDAFSVPAGNTGCGVRLIVSGMTSDKLCFTQSSLYSGDVGGTAIFLLPKVQEQQSKQNSKPVTD